MSILNKDRLIIARQFRGSFQKAGCDKAITDGDIYRFENIYMCVNDIILNVKNDLLDNNNSFKNLAKNIYIVGTKSA
jgi:hypothetical protein